MARDAGTLFQDPEEQFFALTVGDELAFAPSWAGVPAEEIRRRVRDAALRAQLAARLPTPAMRTAPVILAAVSKPLRNEGAGAAPFCFAVQDYAAAVENVMLAIAALGYAGVWMDGQTRMDGNDERIAALLRVPAGMTVHSLIPFGVPEQQPRQAPKKPFGERAVYDHF